MKSIPSSESPPRQAHDNIYMGSCNWACTWVYIEQFCKHIHYASIRAPVLIITRLGR
jgi:hypothetical protein